MKNVKIFKSLFSLFFVLGLVISFVGCAETPKRKVFFQYGENIVAEVVVDDGKTLTIEQVPEDPTKEGYQFVGWFDGETEFNMNTAVTSDVTYFAKFEKLPEPAVYTITFKVDEAVVKEVKVEEGKMMDVTSVPEDPTKEGYEFVGWFNGETAFNANTAVTSDVTYVAKFEKLPEPTVYTITFKVDEEVVKEVKVEEGKMMDVAAVPADPVKKAFAFVGWYNGEAQFNEEAKVTENATYVAKFERSHYVVTFDEKEVLVEVAGVLSLAEVVAPNQEDAYFAGWYAGDVEAVEGMKVESDMAFVAKFVTLASFNGTWTNQDGVWFAIENGQVVNGEFGESGKAFAFDTKTGVLSYKASGYYPDNYSFVVTTTGLRYTHSYWDGVYEEMVNDEKEVAKQEASIYEGNYRADNSSIINIVAGGAVIKYNGSLTTSGIVKEVEGKLVIQYTISSSSTKTVEISFDEKGNLVAEGKVYVKNSDSFSYLYLSENPTFYFFTVNGEQVVVVKDGDASYYGILEGTIALDEIVTITYNEKSVLLKVTGDTSYVVPGQEQGTYTQGENTLTLNGFGDAMVNGAAAKYEVNGAGVIVANGAGYKLDATNKTYETLEKDTANNGKYIYNENNKYTLVLDGFGGATLTYASAYSTSVYKGTYVLTTTSITISDVNYYANGTWTLEEEGKVLSKDGKIYLLEGATFTDVKESLNGAYGDAGQIVISTGKVVVDGTEYTLTYNYNGSKASYEVKHSDTNDYGYTAEFTDVITLSLTATGNLLIGTAHESWDEYSEYAEVTYSQEEVAPYVPATLDAYAGTWVGTLFGSQMTFVVNGDGTGSFNGTAMTYTISGNKLTFTYADGDYSLVGDPSTGILSTEWTYDGGYETGNSYEVVKQSSEETPTLDAYAGTWVGTLFGSQMTFVVNGDGTGSFNGTAMTYTISGNKLTFTYADGDYSLVGDPSTGTLSTEWTYDGGYETGNSYNVTKQ